MTLPSVVPDLVTALVLLTGPVGSPVPEPPADQRPAIAAGLAELARTWELAAEWETPQHDLAGWVDEIRGRRADLADCPRVGEADRLPPAESLWEGLQANRAYRRHLEERWLWEVDRRREIGGAMADAERLYRVWDSARDAACRSCCVAHRRRALRELRELVGGEAFGRGELPPSVPVHRFEQLK